MRLILAFRLIVATAFACVPFIVGAHVKSGRLKLLAAATGKRLALRPELATIFELGVPDSKRAPGGDCWPRPIRPGWWSQESMPTRTRSWPTRSFVNDTSTNRGLRQSGILRSSSPP